MSAMQSSSMFLVQIVLQKYRLIFSQHTKEELAFFLFEPCNMTKNDNNFECCHGLSRFQVLNSDLILMLATNEINLSKSARRHYVAVTGTLVKCRGTNPWASDLLDALKGTFLYQPACLEFVRGYVGIFCLVQIWPLV